MRLIFLIIVFSVRKCTGNNCDGDACVNTIDIPLVTKLSAPLKAELDISTLNTQLKTLIEQEVKREVKRAVTSTVTQELQLAEQKLESKLPGTITSALQRLQEDLKNVPAFTATLSEDFVPPINQVIKFDTVRTNIGGHYSPRTGIFTTPKSGLYMFSATIRAGGGNGKHLHCELWVNNTMYEKAFGTDYSTGTVNAVLQLKVGDKAFIKKDHRGGREAMLGRHWSMFSGYFIV